MAASRARCHGGPLESGGSSSLAARCSPLMSWRSSCCCCCLLGYRTYRARRIVCRTNNGAAPFHWARRPPTVYSIQQTVDNRKCADPRDLSRLDRPDGPDLDGWQPNFKARTNSTCLRAVGLSPRAECHRFPPVAAPSLFHSKAATTAAEPTQCRHDRLPIQMSASKALCAAISAPSSPQIRPLDASDALTDSLAAVL